jgi:hypothetical protein
MGWQIIMLLTDLRKLPMMATTAHRTMFLTGLRKLPMMATTAHTVEQWSWLDWVSCWWWPLLRIEQWSSLVFLLTNKKEVDCCAHHCVEDDCPEVANEDLVVQGPGCFCKRWKFALIMTSLFHSKV